MAIRWRNLLLAGLLIGGPAVASAAQFEGYLMDTSNSSNAELRIEPGGLLSGGVIVAEAYTRETALKPESEKAGYGIFTTANKFIPFDQAGSRKALALIRTSKKEDDFRVEVVGEIKDNVLHVTSIRLMPD